MKVKFTQSVFTGTRSYAVDEVAELAPDHAAHVLKCGLAVAVKDEPKLETADKPADLKPAEVPPVVQITTNQPPVVETATKRKGH